MSLRNKNYYEIINIFSGKIIYIKLMKNNLKKLLFINKYISDLNSFNKYIIKNYKNDILKIADLFIETNKKGRKIIFIGNGGSASICSHVSVDLSKNAKIRSINFNESDLITCLSNDYGHENWMKEAIKLYYDKEDLVVILSCSGNSPNLCNAAKYSLNKNLNVITITGNLKSNKLRSINKKGINIWINSKSFNQIEILFNTILLLIVDLIIGKKIYPPN